MGFKLPSNMDELGEMAGKIVGDIRSTINVIVDDLKKEHSSKSAENHEKKVETKKESK